MRTFNQRRNFLSASFQHQLFEDIVLKCLFKSQGAYTLRISKEYETAISDFRNIFRIIFLQTKILSVINRKICNIFSVIKLRRKNLLQNCCKTVRILKSSDGHNE